MISIGEFREQIVRHDRTMEQIVFPIPEICEYLTKDTKVRVFHTAERDDQGSKVAAFFQRADDMFDEMKWQKKLRGYLHSFSHCIITVSQLTTHLNDNSFVNH